MCKVYQINGIVLTDSVLSHDDIINGGELIFEMNTTPNDYLCITLSNL